MSRVLNITIGDDGAPALLREQADRLRAAARPLLDRIERTAPELADAILASRAAISDLQGNHPDLTREAVWRRIGEQRQALADRVDAIEAAGLQARRELEARLEEAERPAGADPALVLAGEVRASRVWDRVRRVLDKTGDPYAEVARAGERADRELLSVLCSELPEWLRAVGRDGEIEALGELIEQAERPLRDAVEVAVGELRDTLRDRWYFAQLSVGQARHEAEGGVATTLATSQQAPVIDLAAEQARRQAA